MIHLTETGDTFLVLTATQQLQTWHGKGKPGKGYKLQVHKLVHVPLARIEKLKKRDKLLEGFRTEGDVEKSTLKRNGQESMSKCEERFKAIGLKNISTVYCKQMNLVEKQSLGLHLNYKFTSVSQQVIPLEHDYCLRSESVLYSRE